MGPSWHGAAPGPVPSGACRRSAAPSGKNLLVSDDATREFLAELIDDAALFPPARLAMADALRGHAAAAAGGEFWIAGRFVVPASRLLEMAAALDDAPAPLGATVVLDAPAADAAAFADLARAARAVAGRVAVESVELPLRRLPGETDDDRCTVLAEALQGSFASPPAAYVEVPAGGDAGEEALLALHRARSRGAGVAAKIRCGGQRPGDVPSAENVAHFVWVAARLGVPFKATAGLHHAVARIDADGTFAHGYLNVIGGAILAHARGLDRETLGALACERDPAAFALDARRFVWNGIGADAREIAQARSAFVHSYGSCSFDEPVADLRALGMLPPATAPR